MKFLKCSFILMFLLRVSPLMAASIDPYVAMRQAGVDFMIASLAMEEQKNLSCRYLFKKADFIKYDDVKSKVFSKLSSADKKEYVRDLPYLEKQLKAEIKSTFEKTRIDLEATYSKEASCGVLLGFAIDRLGQAKNKWSNLNN